MKNNWEPPVHYFSVIAIVALDIIWGFMEAFIVVASPLFVLVLSLIIGVAGGMTVYAVQRFMAHDEKPQATAKGMVMGIVAGVPFMVTGTVLGLTIIVWLAAASVFKGNNSEKAKPSLEKPSEEERIIYKNVHKDNLN